MGVTYLTLVATLAIALAFVVERLLEILRSIYDVIDGRFDLYHVWTRRAEALRDYLEHRLRVMEHLDAATINQQMGRFEDRFLGQSSGYQGAIPMISADLVRAASLRVITKIVGMAIGIAIAFALRLDLPGLFEDQTKLSPTLGILITGVAIGLGAGPIHKLITTLERRRDARGAAPEAARA